VRTPGRRETVLRAAAVLALLFIFLVGVKGLGDGFKMLGVPETGINIDKVPGPRGPVTYPDLCLRQYAVLPA